MTGRHFETRHYVSERSGRVLDISLCSERDLLVIVKYDPKGWRPGEVGRALEQLGIGMSEQARTGASEVDARPAFRNRQALRQFRRERQRRRR